MEVRRRRGLWWVCGWAEGEDAEADEDGGVEAGGELEVGERGEDHFCLICYDVVVAGLCAFSFTALNQGD